MDLLDEQQELRRNWREVIIAFLASVRDAHVLSSMRTGIRI